ncbi:antirestriction protein ArdA [Blautia obeum]|mgnify:CR=1 FL=1|jgi:antirestriction protein|uniref:Antirestriction protein ArdA n=1 Tax=Blautia obeum TaxID=40520 RepID=A0A415HVE4_9FIRM|nr:antirestriction protein ArdA [Blautia obeum]RHK98205.1 antirestriction protein ArdA [Blautia obeum]
MMRIYLTNLGKYNEGELVGEWVDLPIEKEDLQEAFKRIGIDGKQYEEYFITDYECDFYKIGEYESITTLNEIAEKIDNLDEEQEQVVKVLMSECGYDLDDAIEKAERGDYRIYSNCDNMTDVAYIVIEECGYLDNAPEFLTRYFDYKAYGRDLGIEGSFYFLDNGNCIEIY